MKAKILILAVVFSLASTDSKAQQDPVYSQYMFNMLTINPAYAGSRDVLSVTATHRKQWLGINGSPTTQVLTGDAAIANKRMGVGLQLYNDEIGIVKNTGVGGIYSYRIRLRTGILSMGLKVGINRFIADYASVELSGLPTDQAFAQTQNKFQTTFGAGLYYNTDRFYISFSVPQLGGMKKVYSTNGINTFQLNNSFYLAAGYVIGLSDELKLKPSTLLVASNGAPIHYDLNANLWLRSLISLGASYRSGGSVLGLIELQLSPQFRLGYAYGATLNSLKNLSTHEFMLRYEFGFGKDNIVSPKYF